MAKAKAKAKARTGAKASEAKAKGRQSQALTSLAPIAKNINVRFDKASKLDQDASDHRLAAAIYLAEASDICAKAKLPFKPWCEENVTQSYETARKLLYIGQAENPSEAIAESRSGNAKRNKAHRAKPSDNQPASAPTAPARGGNRATGSETPASPKEALPAYQRAADSVLALAENEQVPALEVAANALDMRVITEERHKQFVRAERLIEGFKTVEGFVAAFRALPIDLRDKALSEMQAIVEVSRDTKQEGDGMDIPDFLKRTKSGDFPKIEPTAKPDKAKRVRRTKKKG